jgi:hypothetical protein
VRWLPRQPAKGRAAVTVTDKIRYKIVAWGFAAGLALTVAVAIPAVQERMEFNRVAESQQPGQVPYPSI